MSRYRWVDLRRAEGFAAAVTIEQAGVSTSAYYAWSKAHQHGATDAEWSEAHLVNEIRDIHGEHDDHGSPRVTRALHRRGERVNHKRVERLMRYHGIYAIDGRRAKVRTTIPDVSAPPLPDLVRRDFSVGEQDRRWAGDITYIPTDEGWLYLADVLDLGSRRVIGYEMADRMPASLVIGALEMAIQTRGGDVTGVIFHSDRGSQGGIKWSSQHLDEEVARWPTGSGRSRCARIGGRSHHRDGRRWRGVRIGSGSGMRSLAA